jgi:RNA polymerase sigma factor (sigma-70 family)
MNRQEEFRELIDACRQRDPEATAELVRRYLPLVQIAVRRRLASVMRVRFDSLDFAQDVWYSFFRAAIDRADLLTEDNLVVYLTRMAQLKVLEEYRHQTTQKIAIDREHQNMKMDRFEDDEPTPSKNAIADDEWERLISRLSERERDMLGMLRKGHTHAEIAAAFGMSEKTIQRLVRRISPLPDVPPSQPS